MSQLLANSLSLGQCNRVAEIPGPRILESHRYFGNVVVLVSARQISQTFIL